MEIGKPEREVTIEPAKLPPGIGKPERKPQPIPVPQPEPVPVGPDE